MRGREGLLTRDFKRRAPRSGMGTMGRRSRSKRRYCFYFLSLFLSRELIKKRKSGVRVRNKIKRGETGESCIYNTDSGQQLREEGDDLKTDEEAMRGGRFGGERGILP